MTHLELIAEAQTLLTRRMGASRTTAALAKRYGLSAKRADQIVEQAVYLLAIADEIKTYKEDHGS